MWPWAVVTRMRFNAAAMSVSDQCPAMLRIVLAASSGVILSCRPGAGIGTRSRECRLPLPVDDQHCLAGGPVHIGDDV